MYFNDLTALRPAAPGMHPAEAVSDYQPCCEHVDLKMQGIRGFRQTVMRYLAQVSRLVPSFPGNDSP